MGRLNIPDPTRERTERQGEPYDISRARLTQRFREIHGEERIQALRRAFRWLIIGAILFAGGRAVYKGLEEKFAPSFQKRPESIERAHPESAE